MASTFTKIKQCTAHNTQGCESATQSTAELPKAKLVCLTDNTVQHARTSLASVQLKQSGPFEKKNLEFDS